MPPSRAQVVHVPVQPPRKPRYLEQAKGYTQRRDYASALVLLHTASRQAPEDVAYRPAAHQLLRTVIQRGRRGIATEAAQLADRVGLSLG